MLYKQISFKVDYPVNVDWGDGVDISYPAGIITGRPSGEVIITSDYPIESIEFIDDNISKVSFDSAPDFKYANELFKGKRNIQVVYFDKNSPIETTHEAFQDSGIIYHGDLSNTAIKQLQYMHLRAKRLECVDGLNTTNAFNAYGIFEDTPKLSHPNSGEIDKLEDTNNGGYKFENTYQCIYPIFNNNFEAPKDSDQFSTSVLFPNDMVYCIPFKDDYLEVVNNEWYNINSMNIQDGMLRVESNYPDYYIFMDIPDQYYTISFTVITDGDAGYIFTNYNTTSKLNFSIEADGTVVFTSNNGIQVRSTTKLEPNTKYTISIVDNGASIKLFLNGVEGAVFDNSAMELYFDLEPFTALRFGYYGSINGYIGDFMVYYRPLSVEEIKVIHEAQ